MKKVLILIALLTLATVSIAEDNVATKTAKTIGDAVGGTIRGVGEAATGIGEEVMGSKDVMKARQEIDQATSDSIRKLLKTSASGKILFEKSYGYAVFDSRKFAFFLATGNGAGVAIEKTTGKKTYMKMATAGASFGAGMQFFQLVVLFENKASMDNFVNNGWEANAAAAAVFGKNSLETNARFVEGMAVYQLNDTGIMADLNITGTKYWVSNELNKKV